MLIISLPEVFGVFTNYYLHSQGDVGLPGTPGRLVSSHYFHLIMLSVCRTHRISKNVEMYSCWCDLKWLDKHFVNMTAFWLTTCYMQCLNIWPTEMESEALR